MDVQQVSDDDERCVSAPIVLNCLYFVRIKMFIIIYNNNYAGCAGCMANRRISRHLVIMITP